RRSRVTCPRGARRRSIRWRRSGRSSRRPGLTLSVAAIVVGLVAPRGVRCGALVRYPWTLQPMWPRSASYRLHGPSAELCRTENLERVMGIEPTSSAWEAEVLPLNYTRAGSLFMHGTGYHGNAREASATMRGQSLHAARHAGPGNGKPAGIDEGTTVAELVHAMGLAERRIAVELNGEILPRSRHAIQRIAPGDVLEIVHAIGGGSAALTSSDGSFAAR